MNIISIKYYRAKKENKINEDLQANKAWISSSKSNSMKYETSLKQFNGHLLSSDSREEKQFEQ
jgi:hypothetical protein